MNDFDPYPAGESKAKKRFETIVADESERNKEFEPMVSNVYESYEKAHQRWMDIEWVKNLHLACRLVTC